MELSMEIFILKQQPKSNPQNQYEQPYQYACWSWCLMGAYPLIREYIQQ